MVWRIVDNPEVAPFLIALGNGLPENAASRVMPPDHVAAVELLAHADLGAS
jgi:hypothetical protein